MREKATSTEETSPNPWVTYLKTNLRSDSYREYSGIKQHVIITGPSWSGKTSLIQSLQLALTGAAYDFNGRPSDAAIKAPRLLAAARPPGHEEISIDAVMDGWVYIWYMSEANKVAHIKTSYPIQFPVERALGLAGSSHFTLAKYFFEYFVPLELIDFPSFKGYYKPKPMFVGTLAGAFLKGFEQVSTLLRVEKKALAEQELAFLKEEDEAKLAVISLKVAGSQVKIKKLKGVVDICTKLIWEKVDEYQCLIQQSLVGYFPSHILGLLVIEVKGKKITLGLRRDNHLYTNFSGGEWAITAFFIALAAMTQSGQLERSVFTLPDRGYDQLTFTMIQSWIATFKICSWLYTTNNLKDFKQDDTTLINLWRTKK